MRFDVEAERLRHQVDLAIAAMVNAERCRLENDLAIALALTAPRYTAFLEVVDDGNGPAVASHWCGHEGDLSDLDWYFPAGSDHELSEVHAAVTLVCEGWNVQPGDMREPGLRTRRHTQPRQVLCYLLHEIVGLSYPEIGHMIRRDHTTVMSSVHAVRRRAKEEPYFAKRVERMTLMLTDRGRGPERNLVEHL